LAFEPQVLGGYASHLTVGITETLETKLEAIRAYATQFPSSKSHVFERVRGAALLAGAAAGFVAGEVFASTRPIGASNLMRLLFPPP
jgi:LmbE family N-acetylglucosaminyl deacetylase